MLTWILRKRGEFTKHKVKLGFLSAAFHLFANEVLDIFHSPITLPSDQCYPPVPVIQLPSPYFWSDFSPISLKNTPLCETGESLILAGLLGKLPEEVVRVATTLWVYWWSPLGQRFIHTGPVHSIPANIDPSVHFHQANSPGSNAKKQNVSDRAKTNKCN